MGLLDSKYALPFIALILLAVVLILVEFFTHAISQVVGRFISAAALPAFEGFALLVLFVAVVFFFFRSSEKQHIDAAVPWSQAFNELYQEGQDEYALASQLTNYYRKNFLQGHQTIDFTTERRLFVTVFHKKTHAPWWMPAKVVLFLRGGLIPNPIGTRLALVKSFDETFSDNKAVDFSVVAYKTEGMDRNALNRQAIRALLALPEEEQAPLILQRPPQSESTFLDQSRGGSQVR